jgi:2-methylfumaryl-CoA isomerase
MVVGLTLKQWRALCKATAIEPAIAALAARLGLDLDAEGHRFQARFEIAELVGAWIAARPFDAVQQAFDAHGVCWGRYQSIGRLVREDPSCSEANPLFRRIEQPGVGTTLAAGTPLAFSAITRSAPRPAPRLGEHTEEVLLDVLRLDHAGYGRLVDRGIVAA